MEYKNRIVYDWLSFTSKIHSPQDLIDLMGFKDVTFESLSGLNGYRDRLYYDGVSICYNGREDMGVYVNLSGHGCRAFERDGNGDYDLIFREIIENWNEESEKRQMKITRLDVAYDDFTDLLDLNAIVSDVFSGNIVSRFEKSKITVDFEGSERGGLTVYHGSRSSNISIRIYDKKQESHVDDVDHWVRCELQLRGSNALGFICVDDTVDNKYFGVLNNYLRYVVPDQSDSNKRRWATAPHWQRFLDSHNDTISIFCKPADTYDLYKLDNYVFGQCAAAVYTMIDVCGIDNFLSRVHKKVSTSKLNPHYRQIKNTHNQHANNILAYLQRNNLLDL